jgi:CheY-like chemotaxis protein
MIAGTGDAPGPDMVDRSQVLIVEDDVALQASLDELFTREGYDVAIANNGSEAIDLFEHGAKPCCVLLDLLMPGMVGHEFLQYLQDSPQASIPVAIITGSPYLAPEGYELFEKPIDTERLLDYVSKRCPL